MQTWKKITVILATILILVVGWLYFRGADSPQLEESNKVENLVFPFESNEENAFFSNNRDTEDSESDEQSDVTDVDQSQLWQVTDIVVAGSEWVTHRGGEEIWFVSRANGHIFASTDKEREVVRITNTTIPQVREALISSNGSYVAYRYLGEEGDIKTYIGSLTTNSTGEVRYQIEGTFLPDNISAMDFSPNGDELFYVQPVSDGVVGVIYTPSSEQTEVIFESTIREWKSVWSQPDKITLHTAADSGSTGFAYQLGVDGSLDKLAEGSGLLASVSANESYLLTSSFSGSDYRAQLQTLPEKNTLMSPQTLVEKCGWARGGVSAFFCGIPNSLPNNPLKMWYQGRLSFNDNLTLFNPVNRNQSALFNEDQLSKGPFDIINIKVDTEFDTVLFTDKRTGTLWGFKL